MKEKLSEFIRRIYLEKNSEMPSVNAMDFEDIIHMGVQWQKEQTELEVKELIKEQTKNLNRIEVVDYTKGGRAYTNYSVRGVQISFQDNNETLKVFVK
jgi:hypothetical protein